MENYRGTIKTEYEGTETVGSDAQSIEATLRQAYYQQLWEEKQQSCSELICVENMYHHFDKIAMNYGPAFQALQDVKFNREGEATGEVVTFPWSREEGHYAQDHVIHPVTLDAAAQLIFLALTAGGSKIIPTKIPTRVSGLWVSSSKLSHPSATSIKTYSKSVFKSYRTTESSLFGLDASTGELSLIITNLETTIVASGSLESTPQKD